MYKLGEKITHRSLGDGIVEAISDNGIVKIRFKEVGLKRLLMDTANKYITRYGEYRYYDTLTKGWYNEDGFDEHGFDKKGIHFKTKSLYDSAGYDVNGYNKNGFNRSGIHFKTKCYYDSDGYNAAGYNVKGFNRRGIHYKTKSFYDLDGYDRNGYNSKGFTVDGIHKQTGTRYNLDGYDAKGNHRSKNYVEIIRRKIDESCEFDFDGFYHMTVFQNVNSILTRGYLYSRNEAVSGNILKKDMEKYLPETKSVLQRTSEKIKDYVRLYFRPKTPVFFKFQQYFESVVLLKFNVKILCINNGRISSGNAGKYNVNLMKITDSSLKMLDCKTIFGSSDIPHSDYDKNMRHTEILIPRLLSVKYLDEVIFQSEEQRRKYIQHYTIPDGVVSVIDKYKFF